MKKIDTYIDKDKFQFITSFEKIEILNTKGEKEILDFSELSIDERIFLSAYLTYLVQNDGIGKNRNHICKNLYDIIFNFNGKNRKDYETKYHDAFISTITDFLKEKLSFAHYIYDHYDNIENGKTVIYRTQLNRSEMDALYTLKFRRSYSSLCNVLYIIGVAKSNTTTSYLNKIPLNKFYSNNTTMSKIRVKEIMEKLNISYKILEGFVYFGNGFNVNLDEKYISDAKKNFNKKVDEELILKSLTNKENTTISTPKKEEIKNEAELLVNEESNEIINKVSEEDFIDEPETAKRTIFDLGIGRLNKGLCKDFLNDEFCEHQIYFNRIIDYANPVKDLGVYNEYMYIREMLNPFISSTKSDEYKVINGFFIEGEDGFDRKRAAIQNINEKINLILNYIQDFYDNDRQKYNNLLLVFLKNYEKLFNID